MNNLSEGDVRNAVEEFVRDGTLTTRWGNNRPTRQAYEMRIFETGEAWAKKGGGTFQEFIKGKRNVYNRFAKEVEKRQRPRTRVFVVMPIQGDRYGTQSDQTIHKTYDDRFEAIEAALQEFDCVAIRIDKESPIGELVARIKDEIRRAGFIVADLTDERPSCYFEAGYAEALDKPVIYLASKESVMNPQQETKIHFDIHQNVRFFSNHDELTSKLKEAVERNRTRLFGEAGEPDAADEIAGPQSNGNG
ncbi:MAG: hypothetical protein QOE75_1449 [Solirubrobacterales bacterium]|nr:hypothetical protein [Solirubrobacterales bacterium]